MLKQVSFGLPFEFALEEMGYSQTQIARIMLLKAAEDAQKQADAEALAAAGGQTPPGTKPAPVPNGGGGVDKSGGANTQ